MTKKYNNESIKMLKGAERVRTRPGVYLGSADINGCKQAFFEILSNALDEFKSGNGKQVNVIKYKDGSISVEDNGRGCPVDFNKNENRYNWELIFCELYAGGKYEETSYVDQLGTNGLGATATQFSSEFFDVCSIRDGFEYLLHFEKGENVGGLTKNKIAKKKYQTGTKITWKSDLEIFTEVDIPSSYFLEILKIQAVINSGVEISFHDEVANKDYFFCYPEGILGYLKEIDKEEGITSPVLLSAVGEGRDREDKPLYNVKFEYSFAFNNKTNLCRFFHNSSPLEYGGSPSDAMKSAFVSVIDKQLSINNKYNKSERKIKFDDIEDSLIYICNSFSTQTSYENQTKKSINNKFIKTFMIEKISEQLEIWFIENKIESDRVLEQILANKRSSESAEKIRVATKKKLMTNVDTMKNRVKKFSPCRSNDKSITELFICEGDSAKTSIIEARDSSFQAVMPIRGKILNCLKADLNTILKSEIIMDLIKVLGCGIEINDKKDKKGKNKNTFNIDNLKWSKVIIATDSDYDGWQIRTLVLTMLFRLCPELIHQGYVYIADTPLYEITLYEKGKETTVYAFSDAELNLLLEKNANKKYKLQRSKGLGENTPEMMRETTLGPEGRHLIKVLPESFEVMNDKFELLLGSNVQRRKEYIEETGHLWMDDLDI